MRVIAGSARGIRLGPVPDGVRPTSDRAREGVFNSLGQFFDGGSALDLYAGTGALGIEALSRGVERAVFVERDRRVAAAIRENLAKAGLRGEVVVGEVRSVVGRLAGGEERFDLIFADPPYRIAHQEIEGILPSLTGLLAEGGRIVAEGDVPFAGEGGSQARTLRYGGTVVTIFHNPGDPDIDDTDEV